ncbi:unnamed protein product, partial [Cladocopium goreaui]
ALSRRANGQEFLEICCPEVLERYGSHPEILDDGRSVHVSVNDVVAFGVLEESGSLIAVNVWRISIPRKFMEEEVMDEDSSEDASPAQPTIVQADFKDASPPKPKTIAAVRQEATKRSLETPSQLHPTAKAKAPGAPGAGMHKSAAKTAAEEVQTKKEALPAKRSRELGISQTLLNPTAKAKAPEMPSALRTSPVTIDVPTVEDSPPAKKPKTETLPEILKPTAKAKAGVRMLGTVNRHMLNGRFSICCEEISGVHGRDAEIPPEHVPMNLKVGDRVSFVVRESEDQQSSPIWAKNLQVLSAPRAPALRAPALRAPATAKPAKMADGKVVDLTEEDAVEVIDEAAPAKANGGSSPRNEAPVEAKAAAVNAAKGGSSPPEKEAPMEAKAAAVKAAKGGSSPPEKEAPMEAKAAAVNAAKGGSSPPEKEAPMEAKAAAVNAAKGGSSPPEKEAPME